MDQQLSGSAAVGHLLRRAGFGLSTDDAESYRALGYAGALDRLLDELDADQPADPAGFDPYEPGAIQQEWMLRMLRGRGALAEKLALFWHGHFATSNRKIREPKLMWQQYRMFRAHGAERFPALVGKVSRDVAMVRWLDGNANRKGQPNENYARELQELFTLGIGNYTETDVREAARAFTGWGSRRDEFVYTAAFHDKGIKTVHGNKGPLTGDDVIRIVTSLPACHAFIARKLLVFFSHGNPTKGEVTELARILERTRGDIRSALFYLFRSPSFLAASRHRALVKSPIEVVISAFRVVGGKTIPLWAHGALERMGQILFQPPSVKGWPNGTAWLTSAGTVERIRAARRISKAFPQASARIVDLAFDGAPPKTLAAILQKLEGPERTARALASPEFQLC